MQVNKIEQVTILQSSGTTTDREGYRDREGERDGVSNAYVLTRTPITCLAKNKKFIQWSVQQVRN